MTKENTFCGKVPGMTSTRAIALFLCCLGLLPGLVACSAQKPWWDVKWEARVPITVEAGGGLLAGRPVILRWGDVICGKDRHGHWGNPPRPDQD